MGVGIGVALPFLRLPQDGTVCNLDPEYCAVEAFYSQIPSTVWRNAASQFFIDVRAALGIATLNDAFDFMYLLAHEVETDALINIVSPGIHNAINVNAMAFQTSRGFTGNGTSSYLNTTYAPALDFDNYIQNSASFGLYCRTDSNDALNAVTDAGCQGVSTRAVNLRLRTLNFVIGSINSVANGMLVANANSTSLFVVNRSAANAQRIYRAGISLVLDTDASSNLPTNNIFIGAFNNNGLASNFSNRQFSFSFAGRSMDATEQLAFYTAVQTFMTAIGAQV